jgi:hypothetical protein
MEKTLFEKYYSWLIFIVFSIFVLLSAYVLVSAIYFNNIAGIIIGVIVAVIDMFVLVVGILLTIKKERIVKYFHTNEKSLLTGDFVSISRVPLNRQIKFTTVNGPAVDKNFCASIKFKKTKAIYLIYNNKPILIDLK